MLFYRGQIVHARSNAVDEHLGEVLVRHGSLSAEDLDRATEKVNRDKKRLGVMLVELGLLDQSGLEEVVARHVREVLAKV